MDLAKEVRYAGQLSALGSDAVARLHRAAVLILGLGGLGAEIGLHLY